VLSDHALPPSQLNRAAALRCQRLFIADGRGAPLRASERRIGIEPLERQGELMPEGAHV